MSIDKEIEEFIQREREVFEDKEKLTSPCQEEGKHKKGKERSENVKRRQELLKEKWKSGRKEIKIACHNTNGLKTKGWKLENLLGWAEEEEIAILGVTETNLSEREERFLIYNTTRKYTGYWSSAAESKRKGSGIGIMIEEQWEKHVGAVKKINEYMISITLYFKQMELIVIGVYIPPNDKATGRSIQQKVVEIISKRKKHTQVVVMGDFNHTVDNILDR
jgi:exonuclease III